jgi:predicted PurR-regulated permease PerM
MGTFPYALTLALIVFILGFIPVIGMFLSAIPILLVSF